MTNNYCLTDTLGCYVVKTAGCDFYGCKLPCCLIKNSWIVLDFHSKKIKISAKINIWIIYSINFKLVKLLMSSQTENIDIMKLDLQSISQRSYISTVSNSKGEVLGSFQF